MRTAPTPTKRARGKRRSKPATAHKRIEDAHKRMDAIEANIRDAIDAVRDRIHATNEEFKLASAMNRIDIRAYVAQEISESDATTKAEIKLVERMERIEARMGLLATAQQTTQSVQAVVYAWSDDERKAARALLDTPPVTSDRAMIAELEQLVAAGEQTIADLRGELSACRNAIGEAWKSDPGLEAMADLPAFAGLPAMVRELVMRNEQLRRRIDEWQQVAVAAGLGQPGAPGAASSTAPTPDPAERPDAICTFERVAAFLDNNLPGIEATPDEFVHRVIAAVLGP